MIFGIHIEESEYFSGYDATINLNHFESFSVLVLDKHGRGPEPKRASKIELLDHIASYGVDPDNPGFKQALRRLRLKKIISRKNYPHIELTFSGSLAAYTLKKNNESFSVIHPIPTIEALAATLRYQEGHEVFANSVVRGGMHLTALRQKMTNEFFDYASFGIDPESPEAEAHSESTIEDLLGSGEFFMYDGHIYMIQAGSESPYDEDWR